MYNQSSSAQTSGSLQAGIRIRGRFSCASSPHVSKRDRDVPDRTSSVTDLEPSECPHLLQSHGSICRYELNGLDFLIFIYICYFLSGRLEHLLSNLFRCIYSYPVPLIGIMSRIEVRTQGPRREALRQVPSSASTGMFMTEPVLENQYLADSSFRRVVDRRSS